MDDEVNGAAFRAYRPSDTYVRIDHVERAQLTLPDAVEELEAIAVLTGGRPTPVLVDIRGLRSITREARAAFADTDLCSRVALFVGSPLSRTIANFFIVVARPDIPSRVFNDEEEAERWLVADADG